MQSMDSNYIPDQEIEALARCLLPSLIEFFKSEEGQAEFECWKREQLEHANGHGD